MTTVQKPFRYFGSLSVILMAWVLAFGLVSGCANQVQPKTRVRTIERPQQYTGMPSPVQEQQAQNLGLQVNWEATEILEDTGYSLTLAHEYKVNGQSLMMQNQIEISTADCRDGARLPYQVGPVFQTGSVFTTIAHTTCWQDHTLYVGVGLMAWNQNGLVQQFILLDLSQDEVARLSKGLGQNGFEPLGYLPHWVSRQF